MDISKLTRGNMRFSEVAIGEIFADRDGSREFIKVSDDKAKCARGWEDCSYMHSPSSIVTRRTPKK
ncbi:hypothetical protein Phi19:2_gp108 [Cellulophaga phage phi19:2]|uniref:Uncharacterized protein n=3 Tax=Cellulophaga phage phiST TaxID=756282 RepID=M4SPM5_9CAUD|nr:hypothetical protein CGPG_00002 [Cellulophaga phage phiST]AGH56701.1 hypothetical protein CGPG_00002 [Cellulophaga phage phiST]AGO47247.1 hypothetical protein PhiST_gp108 [Cellulophaga phage phiST]AGO48743.1 hypothetical protein Phi19:2_gp108 [Cellulophaga phage phi19:2]AGO49114.1 hypothetical protein Phi13:1_gp103 [Cellulophaga phage phi13:1]